VGEAVALRIHVFCCKRLLKTWMAGTSPATDDN
jgi:hypothetical protein